MYLSSAEAIRLRVLKEEIAIATIHEEKSEVIEYLNNIVKELERIQNGQKRDY